MYYSRQPSFWDTMGEYLIPAVAVLSVLSAALPLAKITETISEYGLSQSYSMFDFGVVKAISFLAYPAAIVVMYLLSRFTNFSHQRYHYATIVICVLALIDLFGYPSRVNKAWAEKGISEMVDLSLQSGFYLILIIYIAILFLAIFQIFQNRAVADPFARR